MLITAVLDSQVCVCVEREQFKERCSQLAPPLDSSSATGDIKCKIAQRSHLHMCTHTRVGESTFKI